MKTKLIKIWIIGFCLAATSSAKLAQGGYVKGYTRKDGTYVRGYYRGGLVSSSSAKKRYKSRRYDAPIYMPRVYQAPPNSSGDVNPSASAQGQPLRRIKFARGATSAVVRGSAAFENWEPVDKYVLNAKAGQTLNVHVISDRGKVKVDVYRVGNRQVFVNAGGEDTTDFQGKLPKSGDYIISVYGIRPKAKYAVRIMIK